MSHTPGPWDVGAFDEHLGYDCMTGGIRTGRVVIDGSDYGQQPCMPITAEQRAQMEADARLIAAAPELLTMLKAITLDAARADDKTDAMRERISRAWALIAKAEGK